MTSKKYWILRLPQDTKLKICARKTNIEKDWQKLTGAKKTLKFKNLITYLADKPIYQEELKNLFNRKHRK
jgi:hypothetical protein